MKCMKMTAVAAVLAMAFLCAACCVPAFESDACTDRGDEGPAGDANGDGEVDARDPARLALHLVLPNKFAVRCDCDFNNDGRVDVKDVAYLEMHLLMPCKYPLKTAGEEWQDIVIIFTNDVHCSVDENIGYSGLSAFKKEMQSKYDNVVLVDSGDFIQGKTIGTVSKGSYLIPIMNAVGYDVVALGNHEDDYGVGNLIGLLDELDADVTCCNVTYTGSGEDINDHMSPYVIRSFGDTDVAFIGVLTPTTPTEASPLIFVEDGIMQYDFCGDGDGTRLCDRVQETVDECRSLGADYVVLLSHLGIGEAAGPYRSTELIPRITGVDAVLDAHSHSTIRHQVVKDAVGNDVILTSTGTGLNAIGVLTITSNGFTADLVTDYGGRDPEIDSLIAEIKGEYEGELSETLVETDAALSICDDQGVRMVRNRETGIGDLVADAVRMYTGADIGTFNGGSIRNDLPCGPVCMNDVITVSPFMNVIAVIEIDGAAVADMLEMSCAWVEPEYGSDGNPVGEFGGFLQVSGIRFDVNASIPSPVETDQDGNFVGAEGERRVSNVEILEDGAYVPLDPVKTYTMASTDYLVSGGNGYTMLQDRQATMMNDISEVLSEYLSFIDGKVADSYGQPEGRINLI